MYPLSPDSTSSSASCASSADSNDDARVELQRANQPAAQRLRDRLARRRATCSPSPTPRAPAAHRRSSSAERPAEHERQRHHAELHDVGAVVEPRDAGARRHRHAQVLPQPLAAVAELLDRRAEHVLDDHDARAGVMTMRSGASAPCETSRAFWWSIAIAGHELADEAQRGVDVQIETRRARPPRGCATAARPAGLSETRPSVVPPSSAVDAADARVVGVAEVGQPADPLAEHELEGLRADAARVSMRRNLEGLAAPSGRRGGADSEPVGELGEAGLFITWGRQNPWSVGA